MAFTTTLVFDHNLSKNVSDELWVGAAFDALAGSYLQITEHDDIPYTADGIRLHPDHDFIFESNSCLGLRGGFTFEYSWLEGQTITQQMLDTFVDVVDTTNSGTDVVFGYTQFDPIGRTVVFNLYVPTQPELGWRGSPLDWGILIQTHKMIWDSNGYYLCYLLLAEDWLAWTAKARDIAPNSSLVIGKVEGASTVYLIFSEDVTTSLGVTLNRGVAYSQTSESLEVTTGSSDTLVMRIND